MSRAPRQMPLSLDFRPALGRSDFLVSGSNVEAVRLVSAWREWPGRRLGLSGPPRSGKTHLAHVWIQESGALCVAATDLDDAGVERLIGHSCAVVEDVHELARLDPGRRYVAEQALFHLWNLAAAEGLRLMLTGRDAPARWRIDLPDLASRLSALPLARLAAPDDTLLSSLMVKLFADRQLHVRPDVVRDVLRRVERSCAAVEAAVAALDRLSLERRRAVNRAMVSELFGATDNGPVEG